MAAHTPLPLRPFTLKKRKKKTGAAGRHPLCTPSESATVVYHMELESKDTLSLLCPASQLWPSNPR